MNADQGHATPDHPADRHVVKVSFADSVPSGHYWRLMDWLTDEYGLVATEECEWGDPEGGIRVSIYPEPESRRR